MRLLRLTVSLSLALVIGLPTLGTAQTESPLPPGTQLLTDLPGGDYSYSQAPELLPQACYNACQADQLSFPPGYGGVGSECHAAARMAIPSMLARASAGVR